MSVQLIEKQVLKFLGLDSHGTVSIRGPWGVGKTYAWKTYVKQAKSHNKLAYNRYSYVSLFGIDSLQDLKFQIFQQAIPKEMIGGEVTTKSFGDNILNLSESLGRKSIKSLFKLPYLTNFADALQSAAFLSIKRSLICIDDLERKGKNLSMSDVLGLVSLLKEEKGCKVVLIHNEGAFKGKDQEEFRKYREKVIDVEFEFKPSASECTAIAFSGECDFHEGLTQNCNKLGIDNIRILNKLEWFARQLAPYVKGYDPELEIKLLRTLCLFAWCRYSPDDVSPSYDYVKNVGLNVLGLGGRATSTEQEKHWNAILQDYGYIYVDELDLAVGHLIEKGYIIKNEFSPAAKKMNEKIIAMKGEKSFEEAWDIYHNSFEDNGEEVVKQLFEALKKWVRHVSPINLQGTVKVLRELKGDTLANEAIEYYIDHRSNEKELFNLQEYSFSGDITDETIINRFKETFESGNKTPSLDEVIGRIAIEKGWTPEDEKILAAAMVEDYYELFKSIKGKHLSRQINACLRFGDSTSDQHKEIANKTISALKMIGNESAINKMRVKRYGIHIDEDSS